MGGAEGMRLGSQKVRAHTLDSFFEDMGTRRVDLLHLDMQGAEYDVLVATSSGLLRRVLVIQVEIMDDATAVWEGVPQGQALLDHLTDRGFIPLCTSPRLRDEAYYDAVLVNAWMLPDALHFSVK